MFLQFDTPSRRRLLTSKMILPLSISAGVSYIVYQACGNIMDRNSAPVIATRVVCSLLFLMFATSLWRHTAPRVLWMLIRRPRYVGVPGD